MFVKKKTAIAVWQAITIGVVASVAAGAGAQTATTEKTVVTKPESKPAPAAGN